MSSFSHFIMLFCCAFCLHIFCSKRNKLLLVYFKYDLWMIGLFVFIINFVARVDSCERLVWLHDKCSMSVLWMVSLTLQICQQTQTHTHTDSVLFLFCLFAVSCRMHSPLLFHFCLYKIKRDAKSLHQTHSTNDASKYTGLFSNQPVFVWMRMPKRGMVLLCGCCRSFYCFFGLG